MTGAHPTQPTAAPNALQWRLHPVMAERGIRTATELHRRLQPYDLDITLHQLNRIVTQLPQRLNTRVLAALMATLDCDAGELLRLASSTTPPRRRAKPVAVPATVPATVPVQEPGDAAPAPQASVVPPPPSSGTKPATKAGWGVCGPNVVSLAHTNVPKDR